MSDATVKLGNGNWATKENNLLAYKQVGSKYLNTEFTVARSTDATYVGRDGLIKQMSNLSPELIQNGDFSELGIERIPHNTVDFAVNASWTGNASFSENRLIINGAASHPITATSSTWYKLTIDVYNLNGSALSVMLKSSTYAVPISSTGVNVIYIKTVSYPSYTGLYLSGTNVVLNSISIREVDPYDKWTLGNGWSIGTNKAIHSTDISGDARLQQSGFTNTANYKVTITIANKGTNAYRFFNGIGSGVPLLEGTNSYYVTGLLVGILIIEPQSNDGSNVEFSNITVKQISDVVGDVPRIDFLNNPKGHLLLEPQRTNLLPYSEAFSAFLGVTGGTGVTPIVTDNYAVSPDGSMNASRVRLDIGTGTLVGDFSQIQQFATISNSASYTNSLYIKSADSTNYNIVVSQINGSAIAATAGQSWQRVDRTATSGSTTGEFKIRVRGVGSGEVTDSTVDILTWGAQMEAGSYPTSYIPTSGTAILRSGETCTGAGAAKDFNSVEGVLYSELAGLSDSFTNNEYITISDGTNNNRVGLYHGGGSGMVKGQVVKTVGSTTTTGASVTLGLDVSVFHRAAIHYKLNDFKFFVNGLQEGATDTSVAAFAVDELNTLNFDLGNGSSTRFYGKIKSLQVFNRALVDDELEYLTTNGDLPEWSSFEGMAVAYNYTVK